MLSGHSKSAMRFTHSVFFCSIGINKYQKLFLGLPSEAAVILKSFPQYAVNFSMEDLQVTIELAKVGRHLLKH